MNIIIKNRNGSEIVNNEYKSFTEAVEKNKANLQEADLRGANLQGADLQEANFRGADLRGANFRGANLRGANFQGAYLQEVNLLRADLRGANLRGADLWEAYLRGANLQGAYLQGAYLRGADLLGANLQEAKGMIKIMGVEPGNHYWKRFCEGLQDNGFQFRVGLNALREGEVFAADDREFCSYPGFHFASRSRCAVNYPDRPLEAHIRIPMDAKINEPWATNGKASADKIEILQVFDTRTGEDVTDQYKK